MLIKLDNGDYVNTDHIMVITSDCQMAMDVQSRFRDGDFTQITEADRDRIVEAMGGASATPQDEPISYDELKKLHEWRGL
ncbi:hypothetical protein [Lacticaseibacillus parakribbianus]|uniref:hypothetical protein n=1 Tax=Lacticaseibacillus parakribbianus TaxID=2970927 RepID=UPI0021CB06FA|nr:hypothetical protein [Lacticaseibacillus parakribbianus]